MSLKRKLQNIPPSWRAVLSLWREEYSFRFQVVVGIIVICLSYFFDIDREEFIVVLLLIGVVLAVEALNTAIEELCDHVTPEEHPNIAKIKDLGSGASLLISITAIIIGFIIFIPYLL